MATEYLVLRDTPFNLEPDQDFPPFTFNLPQQAILAGNKRPIFSFMVKPSVTQGQMVFEVDLNGAAQLHNEHTRGNEKSVYWEIANPNSAQVGPNTMKFRVLSGDGKIRFSDIVIWFQRP